MALKTAFGVRPLIGVPKATVLASENFRRQTRGSIYAFTLRLRRKRASRQSTDVFPSELQLEIPSKKYATIFWI